MLASLPMVGELVKKDVGVSYFAPEVFRTQVEKTGAKFLPMPQVAAAGGSVEGGADFIAGIPLVFLGEAAGVIDTVLAGLEVDRPDVIITDALALAGRLAGWKLGIPVVMMFTSYAPSKAFQVSGGWPKYSDEHTARAQAKKMAMELQVKCGGPLLTVDEIFEGTTDFNIVTQPKSFHPCGESYDNHYFFAGAQIAPRVDDSGWQPPTNGKPLLYTSLGSLFNNWPEFYKMLFPVVKDLDINVLCSLGKVLKPEDLGDIPENVTTMAFTPQLEVLSHTDFFITHAGTGSAMEALYYGVPCVCIPQMDEQCMTAGRMVEVGVASAALTKPEVTEDSLRTALNELIANPKYRQNAKAMSDEMHSKGGCARAAQAVIDYVASL
ncbi:MAG: hypothetical protein K2P04_10805 [Oscillospiraceae bacterium]|nr:hypothetical protein [Oscillospiraceae bacterium]